VATSAGFQWISALKCSGIESRNLQKLPEMWRFESRIIFDSCLWMTLLKIVSGENDSTQCTVFKMTSIESLKGITRWDSSSKPCLWTDSIQLIHQTGLKGRLDRNKVSSLFDFHFLTVASPGDARWNLTFDEKGFD